MNEVTRRDFVQAAGTLSALASVAAFPAAAPEPGNADAAAFAHQHVPMPLPFDPKGLNGISEKLIRSHWENNYSGASKALNTLRGRLRQALSDANTPPWMYGDLKREQLIRTGSVVLHELYFANLGGDGKPGADTRTKIARSFGGSGWVVLGYNEGLKLLENYWMADHATNPPDTRPVLVMDMYEHAYQMDYGAAAAKYIDAFFANIQWDTVAKRLA